MPDRPAARQPDPEPTPGQPGPEPTPDAARQRLVRALRRPSGAQVVVAVLLAGLGFAAVTQVRSNELDASYAGYREQDLVDVLSGLAGASERATTQIERLEETRRDLQSDTARRRAALEQARTQAETLAILAGTVPVTGPGIVVTITETTGRVRLESILDTVQELRAAGAEALQLGDVRLVASTAFDETDAGLTADGEPLAPPYRLVAIGDPDALFGGMDFFRGPTDTLEGDGAQVTIDKRDRVDVTAVTAGRPLEEAEPDPDATGGGAPTAGDPAQ